MKIERAVLESVISIKGTKGTGTPNDPVRAVRLYFLPNGTFIGEVNGSGDNNFWHTVCNGLVESYKAPLQGHEPLQNFPRKDRIKGADTTGIKIPSDTVRSIVNEEIDHRWNNFLKATYPPELWQALQSKFPDILSDSHE